MIFGRNMAVGWMAIMVLGLGGAGLPSASAAAGPRDTLVYKDGDRVQGALVERVGEIVVFKSDRFGELRVPAADGIVIKAEPSAVAAIRPPPATPQKQAAAAAERAEEEKLSLWDHFSPAALTAKVRTFFGPWHGRLSMSSEVVSDVSQQHSTALEAQLKRKWRADEVQLNGRYDFSETNAVATTDMIKVGGQWRHDFDQRLFAHYRPTSEWNRASRLRGVPNDYVLLQQELGAGYQLLTKPSRKVRVGVSQNLFDTWNSAPGAEHISRGVVSSFEEAEFTLPWRMTIAQRGVWYPTGEQADGWENRIDLNKKLTETLSTSLRHEVRRNNPDGTAQDYTRLKLLFGLDF